MKQTAVEWLVDKLKIFATEEEMNIIELAKEIERDQMRAVYLMTWMNKDFDFEQYIKEQ